MLSPEPHLDDLCTSDQRLGNRSIGEHHLRHSEEGLL
jgi:hypothetical protein